MKYGVIYWSGTGNTEIMAQGIAEGIKITGAEVELFQVSDIKPEELQNFDALALGCPSMGAEVLEEVEMEPFIEDGTFVGKRVALFGSYDWGDGEWMKDWERRMADDKKAVVFDEGLIVHLTPDNDGVDQCKAFGEKFATA